MAISLSPRMGPTAGQNKPLCYAAHNRWFKKWLECAGLQTWGYSTHSIRRTKGRAVRLGAGIFLESKILGHQDIRTTIAYAGEDEIELRRASLENDPLLRASLRLQSNPNKHRKT